MNDSVNERSSDTPRTDVVAITPIMAEQPSIHKWEQLVLLARTLERELAGRVETIRYVFERILEIAPTDDDNRPIEAQARRAVEHYKGALNRLSEETQAAYDRGFAAGREWESLRTDL